MSPAACDFRAVFVVPTRTGRVVNPRCSFCWIDERPLVMSLTSLRSPLRRSTGALALLALGAVVAGLGVPAAAAAPDGGKLVVTHVDPRHARMVPATSPDARSRANGSRTGRPRSGAPLSRSLLSDVRSYGPDVSSYQHADGRPVDWASVAASGQRFAVVKATELYRGGDGIARLYVNPWLQQDLAGARAAGLVVGSYAYAHPDTAPAQSADAFASAVGVLAPGTLPPVLDLEDSGGLAPVQLVAWTKAFLGRLEADTGLRPMIYTGPYFWASALAGSTEFSSYPLWEASYYFGGLPEAPQAVGGWSTYTLWQYTDRSAVPGITGGVDQSLFRGTQAMLASLAQTPRSALAAPGTLTAGQYLRSDNGQYRLFMQSDGNLVVYGNGRALWNSGTYGHTAARLVVANDGNAAVLSPGGVVLWSTHSAGSQARLSMGSDGNLVLTSAGLVLWSDGSPGSGVSTAVCGLQAGQYLHSRNGRYLAVVQTDGNFVVRTADRALWASRTAGHAGSLLLVQQDGNLVVYLHGQPLWSARAQSTGTSTLNMQDDGNLVLYSGSGRATWASGTQQS